MFADQRHGLLPSAMVVGCLHYSETVAIYRVGTVFEHPHERLCLGVADESEHIVAAHVAESLAQWRNGRIVAVVLPDVQHLVGEHLGKGHTRQVAEHTYLVVVAEACGEASRVEASTL